MAVLNAADRKALPKSDFAVPGKAPASGSYPIPDKAHAANALARSAGKPVAAAVKAKVKAKFPTMGKPDPAEPDADDESKARAKRVKAFEDTNGDQEF